MTTSDRDSVKASATERDVFIALGSNVGDRREHLRTAIAGLPGVAGLSRVYETAAVGGPVGQDPHLNMVVKLHTATSAVELMQIARCLEDEAGRQRTVKDGPRTLDVDILLIEGETHDTEELTVPHPRMWGRRFVLAPLSDLAPDMVPIDWESDTVGEILGTTSL